MRSRGAIGYRAETDVVWIRCVAANAACSDVNPVFSMAQGATSVDE